MVSGQGLLQDLVHPVELKPAVAQYPTVLTVSALCLIDPELFSEVDPPRPRAMIGRRVPQLGPQETVQK
jgi:hypothetical protein